MRENDHFTPKDVESNMHQELLNVQKLFFFIVNDIGTSTD